MAQHDSGPSNGPFLSSEEKEKLYDEYNERRADIDFKLKRHHKPEKR